MKALFLFLICLIFYLELIAQPIIQDLTLNQWQFKERRNTNWRPAQVPGTVHTDLMASKALPDPFWRDNEKWVQWVSNLDWEYKTEFLLQPNLLAKSHINLVFKGLDTYAEVFLNGKSILKTENMFLEYRVDAKPYLKKGVNELNIIFTSPLKAALPDLVSNPQALPATNDAMALKTSPYTRKAGYSYGWDWGPRLVTSGIWRPVFIEAADEAELNEVFLSTKKIDGKNAIISGFISLKNTVSGSYQCEIELGKTRKTITVSDSGRGRKIPFEFQVSSAQFWWTNGLGNPFLYNVKASLSINKTIIDQKNFKFGIRKLEVVHEMDKDGKSFFFKLNGRPVFMKGANFIPLDNFLPRIGEERYLKTLVSAKNANMNMLRVWGGGVYEDDRFYSICDSLGILVWQDFMFACTMYPGTEKFKKLVKEEVKQNVVRLRNHACMAVWCGNNENETGWLKRWIRGGIPYSKADSIEIYGDYKTLFHTIIPEIVKAEDPSRYYTRSSPSANDDNVKPDKIGFGDMHDWFVWFGTGDYRKYKNNVSRFQSEYGYQSFPSMQSIKKFSEPQDWFEDSDVMDVHQKHPNGNSKIRNFSSQFYNKPKDFETFTYVSQLQQAEAMKYAIETHRGRMPYCMGSLYWQLNDCWPAASWSSIDYYGTWKATHFFAKKANEPLILHASIGGDTLNVSIVNEARGDYVVDGLEATWYNFEGKELTRQEYLFNHEKVVDNEVWNKKLTLKRSNWSPADSTSMFLIINTNPKKGSPILTNHIFYKLPKDLKLKEVPIQADLQKAGNVFRLKLKSEYLVKNLYISHKSVSIHFSDNYFDLLPGRAKEVEFEYKGEFSVDDLVYKMLVN